MKAKYTLKQMKVMAKERGGECLSSRYKYRNMDWICSDGHKWKAKPTAIRRGSWCPYCKWNITEEKCRYVLERLTGEDFPRTRLILPNRRELDGYCDKLKIAFEYNGQQHYRYIPFFHKKRSLADIQSTDQEKEKLCEHIGLLLIVIPYFEACTDVELIQFIQKKVPIKYHNYTFQVSSGIKGGMKGFYANLSIFKSLQEIAKQHNGKLLSELYDGRTGRLEWQCLKGHIWACAPLSVKKGSWCPICDGRLLSLDDAHDIAKLRDGKCVSRLYVNNRTELEWECEIGHRWKASLDNVKGRRSWCPICSDTCKLTIEEMHTLATLKNGKCLSKHYINNSTKLEWQCQCEHVWSAVPNHIKNGTWCPKCAEQIMPTIEDMRKIADQRGGECLSDKYINAHTKLEWECKNNHAWFASPTNIKQGKWCRSCYLLSD